MHEAEANANRALAYLNGNDHKRTQPPIPHQPFKSAQNCPLAIGRDSDHSFGLLRYVLKTPYRDGTTHVIFEPLDFIARLAALAPEPRVTLTR